LTASLPHGHRTAARDRDLSSQAAARGHKGQGLLNWFGVAFADTAGLRGAIDEGEARAMRTRSIGAALRRLARSADRGRGRRHTVNLALQGGGAHGAFTWGVLDRLLEQGSFRFAGISGTSAGAMNAVVLASGWLDGGADGARDALAELWRQVAELARLSPLRQGRLPHLALDLTSQLLSPYQLNPLGINPLRGVLERLVDFERLRRERSLRLFIAATSFRTGAPRIFESDELSPAVVLASACLPQVHQAIEIDGEAYWDGGYSSNPPLIPMIERAAARDVLLVRINPVTRDALPTGPADIRNRIGEIVFGRPLEAECEQLALRARRARSPLRLFSTRERRLARHRLHLIDGAEALTRLDPMTKLVPEWSTLVSLRDLGRAAAGDWLAGRAPGRRATPPDASRHAA